MPVIALLVAVPFLIMFTGATFALLLNEASAGFVAFLVFLSVWAFFVRIYNERRRVARMNALQANAELRRIKRHEGFRFYLDSIRNTKTPTKTINP